MRKWDDSECVTLDPDGSGDARLWREYSLALTWCRSCPEYLTNDEVSMWLRYCAHTEPLPWTGRTVLDPPPPQQEQTK